MSNSSFPPHANLVLAPEWAALAKIGKVFHWMYLLIIYTLLFIILLVVGGIVAGFPVPAENFEALFKEHALFCLFFLLGLLTLVIFSIIVGIMMLIRMWNTPESIVPGGGIGRTYVVLVIVNFILGICQGGMQTVDPTAARLFGSLNGILGFVISIMLLVYMWRLADAVGSGRVKSCIKWIVYGYIFFIVLIIAGTVVGSSIGGVLVIAGAVFGLAAFLSYLNSFGYIAKDIEAFIQKNLQEYANALNSQNQPEEGTDSLETEA